MRLATSTSPLDGLLRLPAMLVPGRSGFPKISVKYGSIASGTRGHGRGRVIVEIDGTGPVILQWALRVFIVAASPS